MSTSYLRAIMRSGLNELLSDHALRHGVPGAALGLMTGSTTTTVTHGVADLDTGVPVTDSTRFAVGSITKLMTATLLVELAAQEQVDLDAPLSGLLPELAGSRWASGATPRNLLAGLSRIPLRYDWEFSLTEDSPDALAEITRMTSDAEPATPRWSYSNVAFSVLGRLTEHVTGALWEDSMERLLLRPYGMSTTVCARTGSAVPAASGHNAGPDGIAVVDRWVCRAYCSAGTSVFSTVGDLLAFSRRHLDDPGLATLRNPQTDLSIHGWFDAWGLGLGCFDWGGSAAWGWDGVLPGQRAFVRFIPEQDAALVLLTNGATGRALFRSLIRDLAPDWLGLTVPELQLDPDESTVLPDLQLYTGTYSWPDRTYEVSVEGDGLVMTSSDQRQSAFPIDHRVFVIDRFDPDNPTITFGDFDGDGRPHVVYRMLWGLPRH